MKANRYRDPLKHAPDKSEFALVLIDVINDLEFEGGEQLLEQALPMANALAELKKRAKDAGVPAIYANDNFGRWRSDFRTLVKHCMQEGIRGRPIVSLLAPEEDDYFVLKPRHSAFFQTNLELLLHYLGARTLILTGMAADICVLFTANDAYMRELHPIVPPDCVASEKPEYTRSVFELMQRVLKAKILPSQEISFPHHEKNATSSQADANPSRTRMERFSQAAFTKRYRSGESRLIRRARDRVGGNRLVGLFFCQPDACAPTNATSATESSR